MAKRHARWEAFDAIVRSLQNLENDETLLVQSGKPVGVFRTHEMAPRVLIANSLLVPDWATWEAILGARGGRPDHVRADDGRFVDLHRHPGHPAGNLPDVRRDRRAEVRRDAGRHHHPHRRVGRDGRRSAAGRHDERWRRPRRRGGSHPGAAQDRDRVSRYEAATLDEAVELALAAKRDRRALSIGVHGNAADIFPELLRRGVEIDIVTDQTSAHDPLNGYVPQGYDVEAAAELRVKDPHRYVEEARASMAVQCRAMVGFLTAGAEVFDYGNNLRGEAIQGGFEDAFAYPGFMPAYLRPLMCEGMGPFRWMALSGDPADIATTDRAVADLFPDNHGLQRWMRLAAERVEFQGLPARICWLGYGERHLAGLAFNDLVKSGRVSAPIVIGRDHLDSGSVASPYRETEAMADGSDAIADWPILNALLNTASGAAWVAVHHGGGVGIGKSIHAGAQVVADGTANAALRLERVLTNDPGTGVMRHADAGYQRAIDVAGERGVRIPMLET